MKKKITALAAAALAGAFLLTACDDADVANQNISKDADHYKVTYKPTAIIPNLENTSGD